MLNQLSVVTDCEILICPIFFSPHLKTVIAHPGRGPTLINGCACLLTAARFQSKIQTGMAGKEATGTKHLKPIQATSVIQDTARCL